MLISSVCTPYSVISVNRFMLRYFRRTDMNCIFFSFFGDHHLFITSPAKPKCSLLHAYILQPLLQ